MGLGKYIKKAFLFQWNLLAFLGGMGFAVLSGHPDVRDSAGAGRLRPPTWAFIGTHPRFQRFVDAQDHKTARAQADAEAVERLMNGLPPAQLRRFQALKTAAWLCARSPSSCASPTGADSLRSLDELQLSDLDRLLWIYLRHALHAAHARTILREHERATRFSAEIKRLEERIRRLDKEPESANRTRIRQSLQANLETGRSRLANLEKAQRELRAASGRDREPRNEDPVDH